ncbi:bifunctional diguanylate cyclase/phosphodiesterase [Marinobacterium mangrovicola]|uniref:Diguanylate cyclase (GGDEF)-like protein n=1 Tax=Marinobacterium mangrovicola TaxID=1476959 RepID=A0A4R1GE01_9GAMM|nr:EAL domain-containing protein [Marinobacterium mangrovicola]TCK06118.1 diguanylate cyclase (GGDEF)-like protein [Marinobacterium mangrovicola]
MLRRLQELRQSHPLSLKILASILLASSLFAALVAVAQLYVGFKDELNQLDARLADAEPTFILSLQDAVWRLDEELITYNLTSIQRLPYIAQASLKTPEGSSYSAGEAQGSQHITRKTYPLQQNTPDGSIPLGQLTLQIDRSAAYDNLQREALLIVALQGLKTLIVSALILLILHRLLFRHLLKLRHSASQITLSTPAQAFVYDRSQAQRDDELDQIRNALNAMRQRFIEDAERLKTISTEHRRLALAANTGSAALLIFNADQQPQYANNPFKQLLGVEPWEEVDSQTLKQLGERIAPEQGGLRGVIKNTRSTEEWEKELFWPYDEARPAWINIRCRRFRDQGEELFIFFAIDITEQREARARERHLLEHDLLTGLPNRELALASIDEQLIEDNNLAVLAISIQSYAEVLESLGLQYADQLLLEVCSIIEENLPSDALLARTTGNELLCALPLEEDDQRGGIERLASNLLNTFNTPLWLRKEQINANLNIGIALAPDDGDNGNQLMRHALAALYQSKRGGDRSFRFFKPEMSEALARRLRISTLLKSGQILEELDVYYQPVVQSDSGEISGCEALARWHNEELGWISPEEFIGEAERLNLIGEIGELILQRACIQASEWLYRKPDFVINVNVSPLQMADSGFLRVVNNALQLSGLPSKALKLEVTEQLLLSGNDLIQNKLQQLTDKGISLVIDDFGSGYASMNYLCRFPFQALKIDKSFILNMHDDDRTLRLVEATINLAHTLGLAVVAEGVETARHAESLREMQCELLQGYHFARPMPAEQFSRMLDTRESLICEYSQRS